MNSGSSFPAQLAIVTVAGLFLMGATGFLYAIGGLAVLAVAIKALVWIFGAKTGGDE